ncbi:tRNA (guanine-N1)-methyltransferase [Patiriisocius sp. Uisw_017]|jgi:peptidoglycan hydrolase CwlO-like protein|uniref:tRNA (guanine-N1)-methyltransferase n=1 Tax=Patiriisocius sp. Uisw_017 TaxID=3230968 RepID=UPI0039E771C2
MSSKQLSLFPFLLISVILFGQESQTSDYNSIANQFENVIDKSNSYKEFKVVPKVKLDELRKSILDSVISLETSISTKDTTIAEQENQISTLQSTLETTNNDLTASKEKEDGVFIFGMLLKKDTYNTILFSIIGVLLFLLLFFIFKYKSSNSVTRTTNNKLAETESEFEAYRQKKLEDEQVLRRKLQDEINKNR